MGYDKEDVRDQASGRWRDILIAFGIGESHLDEKHGPCPKCGGTDRWRVFDDFDQKGGAICNKCLPKAGDGFEVIAWWTGRKFSDVVNEVAEHLGMTNGKAKKAKPVKQDVNPLEQVQIGPWREELVPYFCQKNPGITSRGINLAGTSQGKYFNKLCMFFKVFGDDLQSLTGYVAMSLMSKTLPKYNPKDKTSEPVRKLNVRGTKSGLIGESSIKLLAAGGIVETCWKVEGPSDLAALCSIIPEDQWGKHVVVTTPSGAGDSPKWIGQFLTRATVVNVIGDRDTAGQVGANKWVDDVIACGGKAKRIDLPYEMTETKGKDLRDFILDESGELAWGKLLSLAESTREAVDDSAPTKSGDIPRKHQDCLDALGLDVLCQDQTGIFVYSTTAKRTDHIKGSVSKFTQEDLIKIIGIRGEVLIGDDKEDGYSMKEVRRAIAMAASARYIDDAMASMRGIGIYRGEDENGECVVVCNGSHLSVLDGLGNWRRVDTPRYGGLLFKFGSRPWYDHDEIGALIVKAKSDPSWVKFQWDLLKSIVDRWTWRYQQTDPMLVTALVGATWIQDLWRYRPQVSLRGPSNAGKSQFAAFLFGGETKETGIFGDLAFCRSLPSAAGLRQSVGKSSRVICIDEFDSLHYRTKAEILKIIRTAGPGDTITMGSASHRAIEFGLKAICWVSGVMVGLDEQMDSNRFLPFDFIRPPEARWKAWRAPTRDEKQELSRSMMAISIAFGLESARIAANLHQEITSQVHDRIVEGLAGAASLTALSLGGCAEDAREVLEVFVGAISAQASIEVHQATHDELIDQIMTLTIHTGGQMQMSVGTILDDDADYCDGRTEHVNQLESQLGVTKKSVDGEKYLVVHAKSLVKRLEQSPAEIRQLLLRIDGSALKVAKIAKSARRSIWIPWEYVRLRSYQAGIEHDEAEVSF